MIKLVATYDKDAIWYFDTMKQCEEFKNVFQSYGCDICWDEPVEDLYGSYLLDSDEIREVMHETPKKRAKRALPWAYSLMNRRRLALFMEDVTYQRFSDEQKAVIRALGDILFWCNTVQDKPKADDVP